jgi:hypothetical protein
VPAARAAGLLRDVAPGWEAVRSWAAAAAAAAAGEGGCRQGGYQASRLNGALRRCRRGAPGHARLPSSRELSPRITPSSSRALSRITPSSPPRRTPPLLGPVPQANAQTANGQTALHVAVEMAENRWLNRHYDYQLTIKLLLGARALFGGLGLQGLRGGRRDALPGAAAPPKTQGQGFAGAPTAPAPPARTAPRRPRPLAPAHPPPSQGAGSAVDARDSYGQAPIHVATKNLDLATMGMLLDHGARLGAAMEPDGRMPM